MNRTGKLLMVLIVAAVGLWGCSQATTSQSAAQTDKDTIKTLQAKNSKLEDAFKAATVDAEQARKQLAALQTDYGQIQEQLTALQKEVEADKVVAKQRDDLLVQVDARTGERDMLQTRCDKMKKGLQSLLGQDDALSVPSRPPTTAVGGVAGGGL